MESDANLERDDSCDRTIAPNVASLSQFQVEGEKRYWLQVAIDLPRRDNRSAA